MKQNARETIKFLGFRGVSWLLVGVVASLSLATVEYAIAGFLQIFLSNIGLISDDRIPAILIPFARSSSQTLCLMLVLIGIVRAISLFFSQQSTVIFSETLNARLRFLTAYELLMRNEQRTLAASEVNIRFGELFPKAGLFIQAFSTTMINLIQLAFLALGMLWVAWRESLISMLGLLIVGFFVRLLNQAVSRLSALVPKEQLQIIKSIERVTRNWMFVKISGTHVQEYSNLIDRSLNYFNHMTRAKFFIIMASGLPPMVGIMMLAGIIFLSQIQFATTPSALLGFLYLFIRFVQLIGVTVGQFGTCLTYYPQFNASSDIFRSLPESEKAIALEPSGELQSVCQKSTKFSASIPASEIEVKPRQCLAPFIVIDKLSFRWNEDSPMILDNLNLSIPSRSSLGIVGPSGVGKSTLLSLILGFLQPTKGTVTIDKLMASSYLRLRSATIGYVGADPYLIEGSIRGNLEYGNIYAPLKDDEIWSALTRARLADDVKRLHGGLDFILSESGDGLSTGQKQRLAIARALLRSPVLLILDEASANLDATTEEEIAKSLSSLKSSCTIIIVSHREGILKYVDYKFVLNSKEVFDGYSVRV